MQSYITCTCTSAPADTNPSISLSSFPYYEDDADRYTELVLSLYKFYAISATNFVGWIQPWVAAKMPWGKDMLVDHNRKFVVFNPNPRTMTDERDTITDVIRRAKNERTFEVLHGWRNELYPVYGTDSTLAIERAASSLFGIIAMGVHMTAYVQSKDGMKIWVPRRTVTKQTFPGLLDNTVAGGLVEGETPLEGLAREAVEEASFPETLIRKRAKPCGTVSYFFMNTAQAEGHGKEENDDGALLHPEVQYVYDLELGKDEIPVPGDNEVQKFELLHIDEVKTAMAKNWFKPNCALVLLDFFIRHQIITPETEPDYAAIIPHLHRKLPFPTTIHNKSVPP